MVEATSLKARLGLIHGSQQDNNGRKFSGAHETVLPLCSVARSIFNQLRNTTTRKASKRRVNSGAASSFHGRPNGRITGMDMRHLLLLLPFLLFDEVHDHNSLHGTSFESPAADLIAWVLILLEWYRLYRCHSFQNAC
jgi:hypothetical protein